MEESRSGSVEKVDHTNRPRFDFMITFGDVAMLMVFR